MEQILIINDRLDYGDAIVRIVSELGGDPCLVLGDNSAVLIPKVKSLLRKHPGALGATNFKGTILDILLQNEPDGGMKVWESLTKDQRARAGKLVVVTNEKRAAVQEFCAAFAGGRCFAFTHPRLRSLIKAHLF